MKYVIATIGGLLVGALTLLVCYFLMLLTFPPASMEIGGIGSGWSKASQIGWGLIIGFDLSMMLRIVTDWRIAPGMIAGIYSGVTSWRSTMRRAREQAKTTQQKMAKQRHGVIAFMQDRPATASPPSIVGLTKRAAAQITAMLRSHGHPPNTAIRISLEGKDRTECRVQFDLPESDGRQLIGCSLGITTLIEKSEVESFKGTMLDFEGDKFLLISGSESPGYKDPGNQMAPIG